VEVTPPVGVGSLDPGADDPSVGPLDPGAVDPSEGPLDPGAVDPSVGPLDPGADDPSVGPLDPGADVAAPFVGGYSGDVNPTVDAAIVGLPIVASI